MNLVRKRLFADTPVVSVDATRSGAWGSLGSGVSRQSKITLDVRRRPQRQLTSHRRLPRTGTCQGFSPSPTSTLCRCSSTDLRTRCTRLARRIPRRPPAWDNRLPDRTVQYQSSRRARRRQPEQQNLAIAFGFILPDPSLSRGPGRLQGESASAATHTRGGRQREHQETA